MYSLSPRSSFTVLPICLSPCLKVRGSTFLPSSIFKQIYYDYDEGQQWPRSQEIATLNVHIQNILITCLGPFLLDLNVKVAVQNKGV